MCDPRTEEGEIFLTPGNQVDVRSLVRWVNSRIKERVAGGEVDYNRDYKPFIIVLKIGVTRWGKAHLYRAG